MPAVSVLQAYRRALGSQMQPGMLLLAIGPVLAAALFWAFVMWWKWATFFAVVDSLIKTIPYVERFIDRLMIYGIGVVPGVLALWVLIALYIPLTLVCALGFISTVGMPLMLRHVAGRDYAELAHLHGGNLVGSLANSTLALAKFILLAMLTFPLWFIPLFGWLVLPFLLGRLNTRVLRYDALAEHASADEISRLAYARDLHWGWLGYAGALFNLIPFFWFFSTTLTGLAFIHYGLSALATERGNPIKEFA